MALFVFTLGRTLVKIYKLHFFVVVIYQRWKNVNKNWHQLAEEKSKLDKQTEEIHQKFRMDKINKEFGQLSGEELFKPITKRLDEKSSDNVEEEKEEEEVPDESRSDASPPAYKEFDDPGSSKDETKEETSKRLRTVKSILAKYGSDPTYKVKSKGSKYYGYNVEQLKAEAFNLETIKAN